MLVKEQIEKGILVCPKTKTKLHIQSDKLVNENSAEMKYAFLNGNIPILLENQEWAGEYINDSEKMVSEYSAASLKKDKSILRRIKKRLLQDYPSELSTRALSDQLNKLDDSTVNISIGGGPIRIDENITNLNIGPFPNVDVVGDAHNLPYADESVDFIHSEAVFEHLYNPLKAAQEMYRVLKKGKSAYVCTPFMQAYHGYPHHYQNYTITGHQQLFKSVGFSIVEAGPSTGPVFTIFDLNGLFLNEYLPFPINKLFKYVWHMLGVIIKPYDKVLLKKKNSYMLASTTYVLLRK
ncbi:MAG: hypothetical protein C0412_02950 [Flavobacterium sp.]|nr:hypothetical protein [Flavobacterium sp.]